MHVKVEILIDDKVVPGKTLISNGPNGEVTITGTALIQTELGESEGAAKPKLTIKVTSLDGKQVQIVGNRSSVDIHQLRLE